MNEAILVPSPCPRCKRIQTAAADIYDKDAIPIPGDVSVCLYCQEVAVFGDDLILREPTEDEIAEWPLAEIARLQRLITSKNESDARRKHLESCGYTDVVEIRPEFWCGIARMIFTVGVCYGLDDTGLQGRFCFDTYQNAKLFLDEWDGQTLPVIGEDGCTAIK